MDAMDRELATKGQATKGKAASTPQAGKAASAPPEEADDTDMDSDEELSAQDQELISKLISSGTNLSELAASDDSPMIQLNTIKSFLESYKAQGGSAGPVSNLAGRMNVGTLPQDKQ